MCLLANAYHVETYKFAASEIKDSPPNYVALPDNNFGSALNIGIARKISDFLEKVEESSAQKLGLNLRGIVEEAEAKLRKKSGDEFEKDKTYAELVNNHGPPHNIETAVAAVHYIAGLRLVRFVVERMEGGNAGDYYAFCKELKERIVTFLRTFAKPYDLNAPKKSEICPVCGIVEKDIPKYKGLMEVLETSLKEMAVHVSR